MKSIKINKIQYATLIEGSIAIHDKDADSIIYIEPKRGSCFVMSDLQRFAKLFGEVVVAV